MSKDCPKWKQEKRVQQVKDERNISFVEARKMVANEGHNLLAHELPSPLQLFSLFLSLQQHAAQQLPNQALSQVPEWLITRAELSRQILLGRFLPPPQLLWRKLVRKHTSLRCFLCQSNRLLAALACHLPHQLLKAVTPLHLQPNQKIKRQRSIRQKDKKM